MFYKKLSRGKSSQFYHITATGNLAASAID